MDVQRKAFEAYMAEKYKNLMDRRQCLNNGGGYMAWDMNVAWQVWQAAKAQSVPEWISVKDQLPPSDPYNREYWVYETLNNKVQHDYWVCPDTGLDQDFEPFFNNWPREVTHWMPMVKYPKPPVQAQEPAND